MHEEVSNLEHLKSKCDEIRTLLRKHRNDAGLTQDDTANWIGATRKQIIELENGTRFDIELLPPFESGILWSITLKSFLSIKLV